MNVSLERGPLVSSSPREVPCLACSAPIPSMCTLLMPLFYQRLKSLLSLDLVCCRISTVMVAALCGFDEDTRRLGLNSLFIWVHNLGITVPCCKAPAFCCLQHRYGAGCFHP